MISWHESDGKQRAAIVAAGLCLVTGLGGFTRWLIAPSPAELRAEGRELFVHEWTPDDPLSNGGDGLGPVFNATSCVACHSQGGVGGAGGNEHNVQTFTVLPNRRNPQLLGGVVHAAAVAAPFMESRERVNRLFPIVPGGTRVINGCSYKQPDFNPVVFGEINTPALFGAGRIDDISAWAIRKGSWSKGLGAIGEELNGEFKHTRPGRPRMLSRGRVGRFGWKAQFATLEEFVATACAVELGLTNHIRAQDIPREHQPDADAEYDMSRRQLDALAAFCRHLEQPSRIVPDNPAARDRVQRGEQLFDDIGCTDCHTPSLGGVDGIYSDLCLHRLASPGDSDTGYDLDPDPDTPFPVGEPLPDEWKTPPLWGVADTAPYMHDGSALTLSAAIGRHRGDARHVTKRYDELDDAGRDAVIAFLESMRLPGADQP